MSKGILESFYSSKRWQRCRDAFMSSRGFVCERCGRPAVIAHHRIYLTEENVGDPDISLNPDNLESLCRSCHEEEHRHSRPTVEGVEFDEEGRLVKIPEKRFRCAPATKSAKPESCAIPRAE